MKHILPIFVFAAMLFTACNQNEPTNTKKGGETISLDGRIYYCLQTGEKNDIEYYLLFKPENIVVDSAAMKWHIEPTGIDVASPVIWTYTLDGELLTLHNENNYPYADYNYATYRDSVIYRSSRKYRRQ